MDVTLRLESLAINAKLSSYKVQKEVTYREVITTLDDIEHPYPPVKRTLLDFSLQPMTDAESAEIYSALSAQALSVTYTDPYSGTDRTQTMRVVSSLEAVFALKSVDGNCRYKGGTIQMRASHADN